MLPLVPLLKEWGRPDRLGAHLLKPLRTFDVPLTVLDVFVVSLGTRELGAYSYTWAPVPSLERLRAPEV